MTRKLVFAAAAAVAFTHMLEAAFVPELIHYQGRLVLGTNLVSGTVTVRFAIYTSPSGGTAVYQETQTVAVVDGLYATAIGASNTVAGALRQALSSVTNQPWLEVSVNGQPLTPRERIAAVAYALTSTAGWSLDGNSGLAAGVNFLGTTDNTPLEFRANGFRAMLIRPDAAGPSIVGGHPNNVVSTGVAGAVISGGGKFQEPNSVASDFGAVGGGYSNRVSGGEGGTIGGGGGNRVEQMFGAIGGGQSNKVSGAHGVVAGGLQNAAQNAGAGIGGGAYNSAAGDYATIAGGFDNTVQDYQGYIGGGAQNLAAYQGVIGGGLLNTAGTLAVVGGGEGNGASGVDSAVGGGKHNYALGGSAVVAGGELNFSSNDWSAVVGGFRNQVGGDLSSVVGGERNWAIGANAFVGGGLKNVAAGYQSAVLGGNENLASGTLSVAMGNRAKANHDGSFVWGDSTPSDIASTTNDQWTVRASGGVRFFSESTATIGVELVAGGSGWNSVSDRNLKENIQPVDGVDVLNRLASIPISRWTYIGQPTGIWQIGPMAQDFYQAFQLGGKPTSINSVNADGISMAAIQGVYRLVIELQEENRQLKQRLDQIERDVHPAGPPEDDLSVLRDNAPARH